MDYSTTPKPGQTEEQAAKEALDALGARWNSFNRIYQAAMNSLYTIQGMFGTMMSLTNTVLENCGKIGNSLLNYNVIDENAFEPMAENLPLTGKIGKLLKFNEQLGNISALVGVFSQITSDIVQIQDEVKQIQDNAKEISDAIDEAKKPVKEERTTAETESELKFPLEDLSSINLFSEFF
jgi:methyl-accepting chemotaxis protein